MVVRAWNQTWGTCSFVNIFNRFCFQLFQRLLALTFDSSHMCPHFDVIFCGLLEGFSEFSFIERVLCYRLDKPFILLFYRLIVNNSIYNVFWGNGRGNNPAVKTERRLGFSESRLIIFGVKFGMISLMDVLNHEWVIFESLDLLLTGFKVSGKFLEFGELLYFAIEDFGFEFGVKLTVLNFSDFLEMSLVVEFALFVEKIVGTELRGMHRLIAVNHWS